MVIKKIIDKVFDKKQRDLTAVYVFALSSIALMAILFQMVKFAIHADQLETIAAIRAVEKQKIFSERTRSRILDAQISINTNLEQSLNSIQKSIQFLVEKNGVLVNTLPSTICQNAPCRKIYEPDLFQNNLSLERLSPEGVETLLTSVSQYHSLLENLTNKLDSKINNTTRTILNLDILFLFLLLIVLVMQAMWGFKPAVKRLNEALSVRSDFISRISHEIRNPMNSIMGMADILKSTRLTSEQNQYVNNLQRSSHVLLDMLNNLVDFSGLESNSIQLKNSKFSIYKMVDKVTDIVSIQAHEKNLELIVDIDPKIPKIIYGDVARIEQVLINLLNNALKFTNKGFIRLKVCSLFEDPVEENITLNFEVEDSGIGIESSKLEGIFQSFVQEDSSIKRRFGGSGLGLAICKEIVGLMGAQINVESQKNIGSKFEFAVNFDYESRDQNSSDFFLNEKIVFITELKNIEKIEAYIKQLTQDYKIVSGIKDLEEAIDSSKPTKFIVDDSLGIINMINAATILSKNVAMETVYALMRSNFSKENMELIRKNGFKNFLIKPFRAWHMFESMGRNNFRFDEINDNTHLEFLKVEIKGRKLSILAVDDSNDNLFLLKEILSPVTDCMDFASNGLEACEQVKKKDYDIVFMDIQMPVMDGYTAIKKIRKDFHNLPIFAVTAHAGLVDEKKCIEAGFTGRMTKPINREKVYKTIQSVFNIQFKIPEGKKMTTEEKMLQKLMPQYFATRIEDLQTLNEAIDDGNFSTIKKIGHRVKGSAKSYGFQEIGDLSYELEKAAENADKETCERLIQQIESDILTAKQNFEAGPRLS